MLVGGFRFGNRLWTVLPSTYAATGFLRLRAEALRRMIRRSDPPLCITDRGQGSWPFFQSLVLLLEDGSQHYLVGDLAFGHRQARIGVVPLADTSIRLWHFGRNPYGWEEAGTAPRRVTYPSPTA